MWTMLNDLTFGEHHKGTVRPEDEDRMDFEIFLNKKERQPIMALFKPLVSADKY